MAADETWGRNLRSAKRRYEERHDTSLTYKEIGRRVAETVGRATPFSHSAVLNWIENGQEPEGFAIVRALAIVLEADVGELLSVNHGVSADSTSAGKDTQHVAAADDAASQTPVPVEGATRPRRRLEDIPDPYIMPKVTREDLAARATSKAPGKGRRRRA